MIIGLTLIALTVIVR
ncbi:MULTISPECIES: hypothetical protein [Pantoea]